MFTADMAVHNFCGLAMRGATWVALHNGGGTGWGEAINGGFGFVLDGEESTSERVRKLQFWDVMNGVTRRAWSGNENAQWIVENEKQNLYSVTKASSVDDDMLNNLFSNSK